MKSPLVNWLPWSVLKISGRPCCETAHRPDPAQLRPQPGGLGQDVAIDIESDDDIAALFVVERTKIVSPGLGGGRAGGLGFVTINGKAIDHRRPQFVRGGDRIVLGTPGGGGFGSANLRSTADRERDQKMGYVER